MTLNIESLTPSTATREESDGGNGERRNQPVVWRRGGGVWDTGIVRSTSEESKVFTSLSSTVNPDQNLQKLKHFLLFILFESTPWSPDNDSEN